MNVYKVKRTETPSRPMHIAGSSGGRSSGSFQQQFGKQMNEDYKSRVTALFEEIVNEAAGIAEPVDILKFEKHRRLIRELLNEVAKNAYDLHSECVLDATGRQKIYAAINIIDQRLDAMAREILNRNRDWINYLSRMDEIRGLIMDILL